MSFCSCNFSLRKHAISREQAHHLPLRRSHPGLLIYPRVKTEGKYGDCIQTAIIMTSSFFLEQISKKLSNLKQGFLPQQTVSDMNHFYLVLKQRGKVEHSKTIRRGVCERIDKHKRMAGDPAVLGTLHLWIKSTRSQAVQCCCQRCVPRHYAV